MDNSWKRKPRSTNFPPTSCTHRTRNADALHENCTKPRPNAGGLENEPGEDHPLHPPLLDEAGLGPALRWYATGFAERSGIAADLNLPPDLSRLPEEVETAIFRIVQEALTNIHRHSGSATATIALRQDVDHVELEVKDQGRGMGAVEVKKGAESPVTVGVGIAGMRE